MSETPHKQRNVEARQRKSRNRLLHIRRLERIVASLRISQHTMWQREQEWKKRYYDLIDAKSEKCRCWSCRVRAWW